VTRILVTGAGGYVGRQVVAALRGSGYEVTGVARRDADLLDPEQVDRLLAIVRPTQLVHLAWVTTHGAFPTHPDNDRWLDASLLLLESFLRVGGRRIVTAGSCAEYAWEGDAPLSEERSPCRPVSPYAKAKLELYERAAGYCRQRGMSHAHARLFFSYGPGEQRARLVPSVILALLDGRPIEIANPDSVRDYLEVRDLGRGLAMLVASEIEGAVNVASGAGIAIRDLVEAIAAVAGHGELVSFRPAGKADTVVADAGKLSRAVGFAPAISFEDGLADAVRWWQHATVSV
jgi:nucleoside-diphosphate-sugar epimerase